MLRIAFLLLCILSNCSGPLPSSSSMWTEQNGKLKVLCTTGMIQDLVSQIGAERVDAIGLIAAGVDPHSYELVKGDDEKFSFAQIVFYNGLGLEHGASLNYQLHAHPMAVNLGGSVKEHFPKEILYVDGQEDPHIWMDIRLWSLVIEPIVDALSQQDPEGQSFYRQKAMLVRKELLQTHEDVYHLVQSIPEQQRYIVTSHDAFNYFTKAYLAEQGELATGDWSKRFDAPEGLAPEGQLSTFDISQVVNHLMRYNIHVVFPESNVSRDSLKKIVDACRQKGFKVHLSQDVLYGDSMAPGDELASHYPGMIQYDAQILQLNLERN